MIAGVCGFFPIVESLFVRRTCFLFSFVKFSFVPLIFFSSPVFPFSSRSPRLFLRKKQAKKHFPPNLADFDFSVGNTGIVVLFLWYLVHGWYVAPLVPLVAFSETFPPNMGDAAFWSGNHGLVTLQTWLRPCPSELPCALSRFLAVSLKLGDEIAGKLSENAPDGIGMLFASFYSSQNGLFSSN